MGCWNGTCMVSNLPIIHGDKVKLVMLHNPTMVLDANENPFSSSGVCYHNTYLQPAFFPISGEYNDYGNIEDIVKDWNYDLITNVLKEELGDVIIVDGSHKREWVLEDILEGIERGSVKYTGIDRKERENKKFAEMMAKSFADEIKDGTLVDEYQKFVKLAEKDLVPEKQNLNFSFVMIREDIWNHIIENYKGEYWNPIRDKNDPDSPYYVTALDYYKYEYNKQLERIVDALKRVSKIPKDERKDAQFIIDGLSDTSIFNKTYAGSGHLYSHIEYFEQLFDGENVITDGEDELFKQWSELMIMSSFISGTRRLWMIQSGAGSQHEGWETHMVLGDKIKEICDAKIKERKEWEDE